MKTIAKFLSELCSQDIKLWVEGDRLRCSALKEALTPDIKAELAARKGEILAFISQANQALQSTSEFIQPVSRQGNLPLSFAQRRLWFLNQLEPQSSAYNIPAAIRLTGKLNIAALEQSINEIVRRHETLRTTFTVVDGEPVQVISAATKLQLPIIDLQTLPETDRETEALRLATLEAQTPFNLKQDSLLRVSLLRLDEQDHVILFTMHHIVSDGWSTGILIRELTTLYKAYDSSQPYNLPQLPIQYVDFAVWQCQWLQGEVLNNQLNYWKQQLGGELPVLELPTDRPRPAIQTYRGATESFALSPSLTAALKNLSQQEGVSLFMTLLAAFKVLLHRYTQQHDILIGSPIANRNRSEIEGLIGFFVNTLVLRSNLQGNPTFKELLAQVREVTLGAYAHQDLPFEQLVEELQPRRNLSHSPLFQVMFILQNTATEVIQLPELILEELTAENNTAKFDITLSLSETEEGLQGGIEYNTDIFDATRITRMLGHFQVLLAGIVANPQQNLSQLPLLTTNEQHQLLVEWNNTQTEYPQDLCIHQLFEAQVEKTPDAVAVVFEDKQLTYHELNCRANQLAHYLQSLGVGADILVGLCVDRSINMIVALLGILKAGGAYLPLGPEYPQERLAFMLEDAQASILLTQSKLVALLPIHKAQVVCLDADWEIINQENQQNLINQVLPENTSYILYTSGSTGKPKAVIVEHRNTVAFLDWAIKAFTHEQLAGVLASTSICFDLSVFEIFATLCSGVQVILAQDALSLPTLAAANQVSLINTVPSAIAELIRLNAIPDSVRTINLAGEALHASLVQQIYQQTKVEQVFNLYGPSEDTTYSTFARVQPGGDMITIGRPIANTQCFVLDEQMQPVPIGVCGELYIAGAGITRGYLNRPELTAQKFVPNPFSQIEGDRVACAEHSRLYNTGDLVRYLPSGNIEYIGRIDHQVKIRGFRIELGEIETILTQHEDVQVSCVIIREDNPGDKRLVAYIVARTGNFSSTNNSELISQLRQYLKENLPEYMVPSAFVLLEKLPLTPNGKIDRRALPIPDQTDSNLGTTYIAPRTPVEEQLAKFWVKLLKVKQVGIEDNFFDLGGHSLLLTQLIFQIRQTWKIELPLSSLFAMPTIALLAQSIETAQKTGSSTLTVTQNNQINWQAEAVLDPTIRPETPIKYPTNTANILLTGSTGFVGAFLLYELLQQTHANIYCLVRAANAEEGKKRIQSSLESYLLWYESFSNRIIPVVGNLTEPLLGISRQKFQVLAELIDVIYHNGAWVHHTSPYSILKAANVLGTQEVLRLASQVKIKPVHFISTNSVFSAEGYSGVKLVQEQDSLDDYQVPSSGYAQSKWVAEKLITIARDRGLPVSIHRIGRVSGHSKTGVFNQNDFLYRLIIGCLKLEKVPEGNMIEDMAPIDYISQAIVHLSRQEKSIGKAFHFVNTQPFHSIKLIDLLSSLGYRLQQISHAQWQADLINIAEHYPEHPLYPLVPLLSEQNNNSAIFNFDCQNTLDGLANTSIVCPPIDDDLLNTYLSHLMQKGFLAALQPEGSDLLDTKITKIILKN
ncbi:MAG: amino acid adenylation domain-containing protein [Nostoc sp. LLA-1]|nr:amino acid adenylation domain-containing protein [Cyanocohniella sp. LLY]